jgi:hypothetical protein
MVWLVTILDSVLHYLLTSLLLFAGLCAMRLVGYAPPFLPAGHSGTSAFLPSLLAFLFSQVYVLCAASKGTRRPS